MLRRWSAWPALVALAAVGCGRDYYYVGRMEVQGDSLVVSFLETCPGAALTWDGTFVDGERVDLSVDVDGDGCDDVYDAWFDLRPLKWRSIARDRTAQGLRVRIAGYDADRGEDCVDYIFAPSQPSRPGWGFPVSCH